MPRNNVCRLAAQNALEQLNILSFVKETDLKNLPTHLKNNRLFLITDGSGRLHVEGECIEISRGTLVFGLAGESLSAETSDDCALMYIDFSGTRADSLLARFAIGTLRRAFSGHEGLLPLWSESLLRANDASVDLAAESILLYTFSRLDGVGERETLIRKLIAYTEQSFHNPTFSLTSLAKTFSYSPKYVSHLFRAETGVPYSEYLRSLRIRYATTLFDHGIDSVKSVALLSGFSDPLYFSTVFKRTTGMSPTEYLEKS